MTPKNNRAGQALDLEALEKLIEPLTAFSHHDDCKARDNEENEDGDIDDDPIDKQFLDGCNCGIADSWAALQMIRAERTRIRHLEVRTPAPEAVKLVDEFERTTIHIAAPSGFQTATDEKNDSDAHEAARAALLAALSQPLPVAATLPEAAVLVEDFQTAVMNLDAHNRRAPDVIRTKAALIAALDACHPAMVKPAIDPEELEIELAGLLDRITVETGDEEGFYKSEEQFNYFCRDLRALYNAIGDLATWAHKLQSPTVPPNPKGREQEENQA